MISRAFALFAGLGWPRWPAPELLPPRSTFREGEHAASVASQLRRLLRGHLVPLVGRRPPPRRLQAGGLRQGHPPAHGAPAARLRARQEQGEGAGQARRAQGREAARRDHRQAADSADRRPESTDLTRHSDNRFVDMDRPPPCTATCSPRASARGLQRRRAMGGNAPDAVHVSGSVADSYPNARPLLLRGFGFTFGSTSAR